VAAKPPLRVTVEAVTVKVWALSLPESKTMKLVLPWPLTVSGPRIASTVPMKRPWTVSPLPASTSSPLPPELTVSGTAAGVASTVTRDPPADEVSTSMDDT
jgi:hypothetical protein